MGKLWSYKKPTEPGWYMINRGDVVTKDNLEFVLLQKDLDGGLATIDGYSIGPWNHTLKYMPIDYEYLNKIGNESES